MNTQKKPAVRGPLEPSVGRPVAERADYDEDADFECTYCRGSGTDRYADDLFACPFCDGSGEA